MTANKRLIQINPIDNVAVALEDLSCGETIQLTPGKTVTLQEDIRRGHKVALTAIAAGQNIVKYGAPIGAATAAISLGMQVHVHNMATQLSGKLTYCWQPTAAISTGNPLSDDAETTTAQHHFVSNCPETFLGYRRKDGTVGIRNEIWIVPTVGCVNRVAEKLAQTAEKEFAGKAEGVFVWTHPYGCSQLGDDHEHTQRILAALVRHPNAAGVLVIGLGCENNHIQAFRQILGPVDGARVKFLETQGVGDELETGMSLLKELAQYAQTFHREPVPVSELVVGLKCGGSDGLSGITANPLAGMFSDRLIAAGGTTILTEVPEMFGAETLLMNRCVDEATFERTVALINGFKDYYIRHNQVVYENPSPGNKDGGITTLEEKSLGCIQKGGMSPVVDVRFYGEHVVKKGLNLAQGPGNDIVSVTTLAAAGAHLVLFTTGRGTPLGGPVPTVKVSTNDALAENKPHWIDFNAGRLLKETPEHVIDDFMQLVCDVASGTTPTRNETNGYREIAIFKDGVTL